MGLILQKEQNDCLLGIWKITEDFYTLYGMLSLDMEEISMLNGFGSESRKLEWLSVRALANKITGKDSRIIYNDERKPFLKGRKYHISITHSRFLTAILMSMTKKVGIDLEYMFHDIKHISHKFINPQEYISPGDSLRHLYLHWCAKEALYKICDKQGINFKENLTIFPFEPHDEGVMKGRVLNKHGIEDYILNYQIYEGYSIVWTCK